MVIVKFLNLFLIGFICFYLGEVKAKSYKNRVLELNKFQNSLVMFKSKLEYTYETIKEVFTDISQVIYENKNNIFIDTINNDKEIYISWNEAIDNAKNDFTVEDKEIMKMFGKLLGKTDIKGQLSQIELTQKLIEKQIEKAEFEKNKNSKLYKTIGIISGIAICIILV